MPWWISWRAENRNMVSVSEEQMETMAIWEFCHLPAFKTHKRSEFPILQPHVRRPANRSPLRRTIQKVTTPRKWIFQLNKYTHSICFPNEKLKTSRTENLPAQKCQTQKALGPNPEILYGKYTEKNYINFCQNSEKTHTNLCYFSGFVWFQPKAKILFTNWF